VVAIPDGDTFRALHEGREIIIRLRWIDAPEKDQPFGDQAKQALGELMAGQVVTVRIETAVSWPPWCSRTAETSTGSWFDAAGPGGFARTRAT
jgi:hypothetical protein